MAGRDLRCLVGLHSYVRQHPAGERLAGPARQVCRRCGKNRDLDHANVPPAVFG
jgi:hypothetical protein